MGTGQIKLHVRMNREKSVEKRPVVCNFRLQSKDVRVEETRIESSSPTASVPS